jgi:hypothetical protein
MGVEGAPHNNEMQLPTSCKGMRLQLISVLGYHARCDSHLP